MKNIFAFSKKIRAVNLKQKNWIFFIVIFFLFLFVLTACSRGEFGSLEQEREKPDGLVNENNSVKYGSYAEGELIISLAENQEPGTLSAAKSAKVMSNAVNKHQAVLEDTNFTLNNIFAKNNQELTPQNQNIIDFAVNLNLMQDIVSQMGYLNLATFPPDEYDDIFQAAEELENHFTEAGIAVNYIEPNYLVHTTSGNQMHEYQNWNYEMINAPLARERENGSKDVNIAVLDTGVDYEHSSLKNLIKKGRGQNFSNYDYGEGDYLNKDEVMDQNGHGTHVAGIIASYGPVTGVMSQAGLIPIKVLDGVGSGRIIDVARGIAHAVEVEADVINLSLGGGYSQTLEEKVNFARQEGTLLVAAAGNDGKEEVLYPARFDSVLAVGSLTENKNRADFSNYGSSLDVMAPGVEIFSTLSSTYNMDIEEENVTKIDGYKYAFMSGTSMAAPHVAGMAGLIKSFEPGISKENLKNLIKESAHILGSRYQYGEGLIDAYRGVGGRITEPYF